MRPSPLRSQPSPTRGDRFHHCVFSPRLPEGNPGSPGYTSPAGALWNTVLLVLLRKLSG